MIRAFLIDDEPLALKRLARLLEATRRVEIVGRATDPAQGLAELAEASVDVVFLDIHMPGLSGFQVVEQMPANAMVVFTTAYDQHALASRVGERVQLIPVDEVTHVFSRDRGTYAATRTAEHMLDVTIVDLERKLDPAKFVRIHRGTLLNLAWVHELHADFGGRLVVRLRGDTRRELVVSRDRVRPLKERLGLT